MNQLNTDNAPKQTLGELLAKHWPGPHQGVPYNELPLLMRDSFQGIALAFAKDILEPIEKKITEYDKALREITERYVSATPGPWSWFGYFMGNDHSDRGCDSIYLGTQHSGRLVVMSFSKNQPEFQCYENANGDRLDSTYEYKNGELTYSTLYQHPISYRKKGSYEGTLYAAKELSLCDHNGALSAIAHADAQLIANAPEDIRRLLDIVIEAQNVIHDVSFHLSLNSVMGKYHAALESL